jgi:HEAT repeat protein
VEAKNEREIVSMLTAGDQPTRKIGLMLLAAQKGISEAETRALLSIALSKDTPEKELLQTFRAHREEVANIVPKLCGEAAQPDRDVRRNAILHLGTLCVVLPKGGGWDSAIASAMMRAAEDPDERVRERACDGLKYLRGQADQSVPILIRALSDAAPHVRAAGARSLGTSGSRTQRVLQALGPLLLDAHPRARRCAADAIMKLCESHTDDLSINCPAAGSTSVPSAGASAVDRPKSGGGVTLRDMLRGLLEDASVPCIKAALRAFDRIPNLTESEVASIRGLRTHGDGDVRLLARVLSDR